MEKSPEIIKEIQQGEQAGEEPPYRVIIHNEDVTPMDFVVGVLLRIFLLSGPQTLQVMYTAHNPGSMYVQTLPKPEALLRVHRAGGFSTDLHSGEGLTPTRAEQELLRKRKETQN